MDPTVLTTGGGTVYTVPSGRITIVRSVRAVNTSGANALLTLGVNGLAAANAVIWALKLRSGQHIEDDCWWVLEEGDTLQAKSSTATSLTLLVSGAELVL